MATGTATKPRLSKIQKPKGATFTVTNEDLDRAEADADQQMEAIRNGKRPKADPPANDKPTDAAGLLAGVLIIDECDVEYSRIVRSSHNPRLHFDEELIAELAPNIETICQLNPLTIREHSGELIDGETRHRAGAVAKVKRLRCKIVRCTDAQAACIRLQTSVQRRDLNAIEKAKALKTLQEQHGFSQRQLSPIVNLQQGSIANLTRLLELPDEWQQRVISGEITAAAAREIVPYVGEKAVLKDLAQNLKGIREELRSAQLGDQLRHAIRQNSRPLKNGYFWDYSKNRNRTVDLKPTPEQREALRVFRLQGQAGNPEVCFNLELWEELQTANEAAAAEREKKREDKRAAAGGSKTGSNGKKVDAQALKAQREQQEKIFAKKIYRYRIAWFQRQLVSLIGDMDEADILRLAVLYACAGDVSTREQTVCSLVNPGYKGFSISIESECVKLLKASDKTIRDAITAFVGSKFEGWHPAIKPAAIEEIAKHHKIELNQWSMCCKWEGSTDLADYLAILNKSQVIDLIAEWKLTIKYTDSTKRSELVDQVAKEGLGKPTPKLLLNAKPVSLT